MPYKNPEDAKARHARYYMAHRDYIKAHVKRWKADNAAWASAYNKEYQTTHREQSRRYSATYRASHPEKSTQGNHRRRSKEHSLPATLTRAQWEAIKAAYKGLCAYCGKKPTRLTQDHVVPLVKGGSYTKENIVPACFFCNRSKGAKLPTAPVKLVLI